MMQDQSNFQTSFQSISRFIVVGIIVLAVVAVLLAIGAAALSDRLSVYAQAFEQALSIMSPPSNGALWSVTMPNPSGEGFVEAVGVYPSSTLYDTAGAPSLRFTDHAPDPDAHPRHFEIGFYKYGAAWYSSNFITEFWLGDGHGGILSIAGNGAGGGELQVRNPADTDSIRVHFNHPDQPVIETESGIALTLAAREGLISENTHTFKDGINIARDSEYAGQMMDAQWEAGQIMVSSKAVSEGSLVFVTPLSQPRGRWWVAEIIPNEGFIIRSDAPDEDMRFNWLIMGSS